VIAHRTFTEQTTGLTGQAALDNRDRLRDRAVEFVEAELDEGDLISIAETAMALGGLFSVTVWYKKSSQS
jgi:hypothetical protein